MILPCEMSIDIIADIYKDYNVSIIDLYLLNSGKTLYQYNWIDLVYIFKSI